MRQNRLSLAVGALLAGTLQSHAQIPNFCPPGSRQIPYGYGYTCSAVQQSNPAPRVVQPRPQAPAVNYEAQKAIANGQRMDRFEKKLEDDRRETAPGVKVSDIADANAQPKPPGYDYHPKSAAPAAVSLSTSVPTKQVAPEPEIPELAVNIDKRNGRLSNNSTTVRPDDSPRPNSQAASVGGALFNGTSNVGNAVTSGGTRNYQDGGISSIQAFPSATPTPAPTVNLTPQQQPGLMSGFKEIGRDIVSLPSNIRKLGSSIWGGSDQPVTPSTQNSTPTLKPLAAQPTQQVGNYQIVGTGQQSSYGEIANIAPNTPAPTAKTTIAPNSVNVPYFGQTSTFSGSYEIVGPSK